MRFELWSPFATRSSTCFSSLSYQTISSREFIAQYLKIIREHTCWQTINDCHLAPSISVSSITSSGLMCITRKRIPMGILWLSSVLQNWWMPTIWPKVLGDSFSNLIESVSKVGDTRQGWLYDFWEYTMIVWRRVKVSSIWKVCIVRISVRLPNFNTIVIGRNPVGNFRNHFVNGIGAMGVDLALTVLGLAKSQILGDRSALKWYHVTVWETAP